MTPARRAWRWGAAWVRNLSLRAAAAFTILGLVAAAGLALWLTGRPEGGEWWDFHPKVLEWKDRLTFAGAVAAGVGAAIALVVSYRKQRDAEDGKFAAAFAAAATQLGDQAPAVRIAGAYALAALADRYAQHRQQCIEALCAYIRLSYTPEAHKQNLTSTTRNRVIEDGVTSTDTVAHRPDDREVRLTIIRIIRDHLRDPRDPTTWCSSDLDFTGATFDGGDFSGATFSGGVVSFGGVTFSGGTVTFGGVTFSGGTVTFDSATFSGGTVTFDSATFSGAVVIFDSATFSGGTVTFDRATFSGAVVIFGSATFSGGRVSFAWAEFSGGVVMFIGAEFSDGNVLFPWAEFSGGGVSFDNATFSGRAVMFSGARFSGGGVSFDGAKFSGGVSFGEARFSGGEVSFDRATFSGGVVAFDRATFSGATVKFGSAMFSGGRVTFIGAKFSGSKVTFIGAEFSGSKVPLDGTQFSGGVVSFDRATFSGGEVTRDGQPFRGFPAPEETSRVGSRGTCHFLIELSSACHFSPSCHQEQCFRHGVAGPGGCRGSVPRRARRLGREPSG